MVRFFYGANPRAAAVAPLGSPRCPHAGTGHGPRLHSGAAPTPGAGEPVLAADLPQTPPAVQDAGRPGALRVSCPGTAFFFRQGEAKKNGGKKTKKNRKKI